MTCRQVFEKMYDKMRERLLKDEDDEDNDPDVKCTYCTRKARVVDFDDLHPGDHITMGGKNWMFNFRGRQMSFYTHHAIVRDIQKVNATTGIATLIHFSSVSFDEAIQISETKEMIDLHYYELYKVKYAHDTHRPEKIIERAESLTNASKSYSLASCNCEHLCHWCCVGNADSFQVHDVYATLRRIATGSLNFGEHIVKFVARALMVSLDEITKAGSQTAAYIGVPWGILSAFALAYLIYCIYRHHCLNRDMSLGLICSICCTQQKLDLWLMFFVFCATQAGGIVLLSLVIAAGASTGIIGGCVAIVSVFSIALMIGIPKLKNALRSPFHGPKVTVKSIKDLQIGDVVSFDYKLQVHDGIISVVQRISNIQAKVSLIHYSLPSVFGRRRIQEDTFNVDITENLIKRHIYDGYVVHPPEVVLQRARQRLGETKFGIFSNRSCHFCHWAKVNEDVDDAPPDNSSPTRQICFRRSIRLGEDISSFEQINVDHRISRKHSTKTMGKSWARIPQDVKEGSLIQFQYGTLQMWHFAVTTEVEYTTEPSSLLAVTVVHYGKGSRPCEETFHFDLRRDDIWIYKYHPLSRYSRKDVIRRARARIDSDKYKVFRNSSSHFAKQVVRKDQDEIVTNCSTIKPGDVIIFYYWSLKHAAIVVNIAESCSKEDTRAFVTIIHYALDTLFSKRTIKQETIILDLSRDDVYRRNYEDETYTPDRVLLRAKSRLNEQRFDINCNTSWHMVHWAKVVQAPTKYMRLNSRDEPEDEFVLLPQVGKTYGHFQRVPVHAWRDLQPGIIIEYKYYKIWHQAILTDVDCKAKKITVIHYGTKTIFSTRTIMKDTFSVNLTRDELWMYRCDPNLCNTPEVIIAKAYERLGEKQWRKDNRSFDFCKSCVLKKRTRSLDGTEEFDPSIRSSS